MPVKRAYIYWIPLFGGTINVKSGNLLGFYLSRLGTFKLLLSMIKVRV